MEKRSQARASRNRNGKESAKSTGKEGIPGWRPCTNRAASFLVRMWRVWRGHDRNRDSLPFRGYQGAGGKNEEKKIEKKRTSTTEATHG